MLNVAVVASPPLHVFVALRGVSSPEAMVLVLRVVHLLSSLWSPAFLSAKR